MGIEKDLGDGLFVTRGGEGVKLQEMMRNSWLTRIDWSGNFDT
jgi:hypothetical protein